MPVCTRMTLAAASSPGFTFVGSPLIVATMVRVCSIPIDPSDRAVARSGRTGSATAPEGWTWGSTTFAVLTLALAWGPEIVSVSRSSAMVDAGPERGGGVPGVDLSGEADLGCVAEPGQAFDGLCQGQ